MKILRKKCNFTYLGLAAALAAWYNKDGHNMNWMLELTQDKVLQDTLTRFLNQYGFSDLKEALLQYSKFEQDYICKTKTSISKFKISDIYYLEIQTHAITLHTQHGVYQKYGSLAKEQKRLSPYGFIKCNQSCIVSLRKIRSICNNTITLVNDVQLHISQLYAPKVLIAFSRGSVYK